MVAVPASDQYGSSVSIKVPARGKNQAAGRYGPLGSLLSAWAPSGQGTECQGSWTVGRVQPRRGHRPGLLSAQQCRVSFLAAAGQAWVLPSERLEGSGQLPGPRPLPCPLNYGEPQPLRPEESRPGRPPPRLKSADVGQGPRVRLGGSWRKSRERTRFCRFCWPEVTANPPQNGVRKTKARMRSSAPGLCQFLSSASIRAGPTLRQDRAPAPAGGKRVSLYSSANKSQVLGRTLFGLNRVTWRPMNQTCARSLPAPGVGGCVHTTCGKGDVAQGPRMGMGAGWPEEPPLPVNGGRMNLDGSASW